MPTLNLTVVGEDFFAFRGALSNQNGANPAIRKKLAGAGGVQSSKISVRRCGNAAIGCSAYQAARATELR